MKTIRVGFLGFWSDFVPEEYHFFQVMTDNYNVVLTDEPDYLICSVFGEKYAYCRYPQIRIMYSGENYIPDFNLIDYAISSYPLTFLDRHLYVPYCIDYNGHCEQLESKKRNYARGFLDEKEYFACFIAGHESEYGIRERFFKRLCEYKRVESAGRYLNNMPEGRTVRYTDSSKTDFQRKCKFSLCFESTRHEGFVTEKITDAFYADTIPVYYGSSTIDNIYNPKAFIDCSKFPSFDDAIRRIVELDCNDEEYLAMINEPIFAEGFSPSAFRRDEEAFIRNIFDQPYDQAYRRSRVYTPKSFDSYLDPDKLLDYISFNRLVRAVGNRIIKKVGSISTHIRR